ncbi:hypothetical protein F4679DRAFT_562254 [Xylaria curta]|nr:hypothetical protein F4679DRAFT_562254 [Xylaria curta]
MAGSAPSLQWSLDTTTGSVISFATDLLKVLSGDNIPFNALLIAERFGNTLAICRDTRDHVRNKAKRQHSNTIQFLSSRFGYAKYDTAHYLSESDPGQRFLGLAAALLSTSGIVFAANALELMIRQSGPERLSTEYLPNPTQLQMLLKALEHKLSDTSFAAQVATYQRELSQLPGAPSSFRQMCRDEQCHPSDEMLGTLVSSFRSIDRLGDGTSVTIQAHRCIPWIAAFTTWCLGSKPTITWENGTIVSNGLGNVNIMVLSSTEQDEGVRVMHPLGDPTVLWSGKAEPQDVWSGMIPIKIYGRQRIASGELDFNSQIGKDALLQALTYALPKVMSNLWPTVTRTVSSKDPPYHPARAAPGLERYRGHIFPAYLQVINVLSEYTDTSTATITAPEDRFIFDLSSVKTYEKTLSSSCSCSDCIEQNRTVNATSADEAQRLPATSRCPITSFRATVAAMTAEILALSLFDFSDPLMVFWPGQDAAVYRCEGMFLEAVEEIIYTRQATKAVAFCRIHDILGLALSMIGHPLASVRAGTWVGSAARGQVTYPSVINHRKLSDRRILGLGGGLGTLIFRDMTFKRVVSRTSKRGLLPPIRQLSKDDETVLGLKNLYEGEKLEWQVEVGDAQLELVFGPTSYPKIYNPFKVLETATRCLFVSCSHKNSSTLEEPDRDCQFATTLAILESDDGYTTVENFKRKRQQNLHTPLQLIPVAGDEDLRLFTMVSTMPGVIRADACLSCCIDACRLAGLPYVTL